MENVSVRTINELFVQKINSPEGLLKVAQEGGVFIRQKLREVSFARKIIPPQYVTRADLQRSVNYDGLVKIVEIEPDSKAMTVNFRGNPTTNYIVGERFEIPFFMISSEDFQKTEEELLAYDMPLTEVIERNAVLDIQKIEDGAFLGQIESAIAVEEAVTPNSKSITGSFSSDGTIARNDLKGLFDLLDGDELKCETILMSSKMFNRLMLYPATTVGDAIGSEQIINGYTYSTVFGRKLVVSNKTSLLGDNIYAFTSPEFFGQFLIQNDTKFWIDKKKNIFTLAAYESVGMGIGNTRSVAKLSLS